MMCAICKLNKNREKLNLHLRTVQFNPFFHSCNYFMKRSKRDMLAPNEIFNTLYVYESHGIWVEKPIFMVRDGF